MSKHEEYDLCKTFWGFYKGYKEAGQILPGAVVYHVANEFGGGARAGFRRKLIGVVPGVFDYCVFWNDGERERIAFIEFKRPSKNPKLSPEQEDFMRNLTLSGIPWVLVTCPHVAIDKLKEWGVIKGYAKN